MMTQRDRKRLVIAANASLAVALIACLAWAILPANVDISPQTGGLSTAPAGPMRAESPLSANDYSIIYQIDLRQPLVDPPPAAAPAPTQAQVTVPVRLVGTVVEPGFSYAMLRNSAGEVKTVGVGESVDGVEVVSIVPGSAVVRYSGQTATLKVEVEENKR
jgi:hypothetical protein